MTEKITNPVLKMLEPFSPNEINQIPKGGLKLDYVGHAALTKRLLETDLNWSWEPFAIGEDGLPKLDERGGLWIRLTVCGITRIGYGDSGNSKGTQAIKEAIGDALRNAGMRFGAALDLWHKGDLFDLTNSRGDGEQKVERRQATPEVSPETLALAKEAYDQVPTIESIEELKDFYTGAKDAGLLSVTVNGKTLNSVITARKSELEKANA
jgi:hypothetical protein